MINAPITYFPKFITDADVAYAELQTLDFKRYGTSPRDEYYCNDFPKTYTYGKGKGQRSYEPSPYSDRILSIRKLIEEQTNTAFEVCFLNRYLNQSDSLNWHSDDSPEMDDIRPIAIVSFGVEREIWFRPIFNKDTMDKPKDPIKKKLEHGSLLLMGPGMQDFWEHRIPKASFQCGERISMTYRGYVNDNSLQLESEQ